MFGFGFSTIPNFLKKRKTKEARRRASWGFKRVTMPAVVGAALANAQGRLLRRHEETKVAPLAILPDLRDILAMCS